MAVIAKQRYKLDIAPKGGWVIVYASQHDDGAREIEFEITNQGRAFSIPASINVSVQGIKSNSGYFTHSCTYSGNLVTMPIADDMTDVTGKAVCVLKFTNSSRQKLATAKFILNVDSDSSSEGIVIDTAVEEIFDQLLNEIRAQAAVFNVNIATLQSMVGTPLIATTAAGMTNHNKIYVYTGNETGYTYGDWYYWDGTEWQSGGQYNSVPIVVDQTPISGSTNPVSSNGVYTALKEDLNDIVDTVPVYVDVEITPNILGTTTKHGCYAEILTGNTPKLRLTNNSIYESFYFIAEKDLEIWYDDSTITATGYVSIATLVNPSNLIEDSAGDYWYGLNNEMPVRYRKNDSNLPSNNNKLSVSTGVLVVLTYQTNIPNLNATKIYVDGVAYELTSNVQLQKSQVEPFLKINRVRKTENQFIITNGNGRYCVIYDNDEAKRCQVWRTNRGDIKTQNGYLMLWNHSDSDGVVRLMDANNVDEADFVGGYHGDEIETLVKMYIDGTEIQPGAEISETEYNSITIYITSNVYHCTGSALEDHIAFVRHKVLIFDDKGFTVKNRWIAQEELQYKLAYMGMLSIDRTFNSETILLGYWDNSSFEYKSNIMATSRTKELTEMCYNTKYGTAKISIKDYTDSNNYRGHVQNYTGSGQERLKTYLGYGEGYVLTMNQGDEFRASTTIVI